MSSQLTGRTKKRKWSGLCPRVTDCISFYSWLMPLKWKKIRTKVTEVCSLISVLGSFACWQKKCYASQIRLVLCHNSSLFSTQTSMTTMMRSTSTSPSPRFHRWFIFFIYPRAFDHVGDKVKATFFLFPDIPRCSRTCGFQHWDQMDLSDESEDKMLAVMFPFA